MNGSLALAALSFDGWRWDERLAVSALALALGALVWAFAYTASEGALRPQRFAFRRAGELLGVVAVYAAVRVWS